VSPRIHKAEFAFANSPYSNVCGCAFAEVAEVATTNRLCRHPRRANNDIFKVHAHCKIFRHHVHHIFHPGVDAEPMQICSKRIRCKPLLQGGYGLAEPEASAAMTHVEKYSAPHRFLNK